jgi:hypothetical protein
MLVCIYAMEPYCQSLADITTLAAAAAAATTTITCGIVNATYQHNLLPPGLSYSENTYELRPV